MDVWWFAPYAVTYQRSVSAIRSHRSSTCFGTAVLPDVSIKTERGLGLSDSICSLGTHFKPSVLHSTTPAHAPTLVASPAGRSAIDISRSSSGRRRRRLAARSLETSSRCLVRGFGNTASRFLKTVLHVSAHGNKRDRLLATAPFLFLTRSRKTRVT